jgi:aspartate 1-decarboxylase
MRRSMLRSKIHRLTVTDANLNYEGSFTVDSGLLEKADILPFEEIQVWNVTRGTRFCTYAIAGPPGSGTACANGGAAHHAQPGDRVIIATFVQLEDAEARTHQPRIVFVNENNRIVAKTGSGEKGA